MKGELHHVIAPPHHLQLEIRAAKRVTARALQKLANGPLLRDIAFFIGRHSHAQGAPAGPGAEYLYLFDFGTVPWFAENAGDGLAESTLEFVPRPVFIPSIEARR